MVVQGKTQKYEIKKNEATGKYEVREVETGQVLKIFDTITIAEMWATRN